MKLFMVISLGEHLSSKSLSLWYQHPSANGISLAIAFFKYQHLLGMSILRVPPRGCSYVRDAVSGPPRDLFSGVGLCSGLIQGRLSSAGWESLWPYKR